MEFREALLAEMQKSKSKLVENRQLKKESKIEEDTEEYLEPRFDSRASFYKKAKVVKKDNGDEELYSYGTHVGGTRNGKPYSKGKWSQTTSRHQAEYFRQKGYDPKEVEVEEGKKLQERDTSKEAILDSVNNKIVPELEWVAEFGKDAGLYGLAELCEEYANALRNTKIEESDKVDAEKFVKDTGRMKKLGLWDGKDNTYADAKKKLDKIDKVNKELNK